jgi:hypothetical protein
MSENMYCATLAAAALFACPSMGRGIFQNRTKTEQAAPATPFPPKQRRQRRGGDSLSGSGRARQRGSTATRAGLFAPFPSPSIARFRYTLTLYRGLSLSFRELSTLFVLSLFFLLSFNEAVKGGGDFSPLPLCPTR